MYLSTWTCWCGLGIASYLPCGAVHGLIQFSLDRHFRAERVYQPTSV